MKRFHVKFLLAFVFLSFLGIERASGYSMLTHEAIIDANWDRLLAPLIRQRFPSASSEDLKKAHAFAYGGALVPDMGYYPLGSRLFSDLLHYVRNGDFVQTLIADSRDANEYAFALGLLCHYYADLDGHSIGVNTSVPLIYPKMKREFGRIVTYGDDKISHIRTEFSFDVLQIARGNYATQTYHDFIGFQVSTELLERAIRETYGLELRDLFGNFDRAVNTFRWAVKNFVPFMTRVAWKTKGDEIRQLSPSANMRNYVYRIRRLKYYKSGGKDKGSFGASIVSFLIRIVPKVGALKILKFKVPSPEAEKLFFESFDMTARDYADAMRTHLRAPLADVDWDTGKITELGEYELADKTYFEWLIRLHKKKFASVNPAMKANLLKFYSQPHTKEFMDASEWKKIDSALAELRGNGR